MNSHFRYTLLMLVAAMWFYPQAALAQAADEPEILTLLPC